MDFIAIDVETANANMSSICQIGIARFANGQLVEEWTTLLDPEEYFDPMNISIHGIMEKMVLGQPKLPEVAPLLRAKLEGTVTVCHTHFDRVALSRAFAKYNLDPITTIWLDSARVVRRTWKELAWKGYGLSNVCRIIGYDFQHHDALEDAKAAGHILLAAFRESQQNLDHWIHRVNRPIDLCNSSSSASIQRDGNPEGDLYGAVLAFTGALELPRSMAADLAAKAGCQVAQGVTKKTTILVVGDQDTMKLAGHEKSSKQRKAEQFIVDGQNIRIICESDFKALVSAE
ncbi:transposase [Pollutimonas nitritireducens]|uniref:Transposase n=1 Tax=Pollutimonas nitritireducens TaxID=2045209 RepID=A0A2N4UJ10_9BURK|nr:exonuclease domain-containing protein [Pollutimonas nitritireducens]PLC54965.1 transposase [Pollutimonas nitritireducens]